MNSIIALVLLAFASVKTVTSITEADGELINLQFVFRHGDRTPKSLYKKDPYRNYEWPEGLAQLTTQGKQRMYEYGKVIRKRYANYIGMVCFSNGQF